MTLIDVLRSSDGAESGTPSRTDALTPTFALAARCVPHAEIVDAELAMRAARRIKTADEIRPR